jgi:ribose transport system substrate-binding protein
MVKCFAGRRVRPSTRKEGRERTMRGHRVWAIVVAVLLVAGTVAFAGGSGEAKAGKGYVIGFSNSYGGNTYRQTMEALFKKLADKMVADGTLKSYKMLQSNNNVATQVSQIESLILDGVDAIIIDPGSAAGLNGAIEKAVNAKIPVVIVNDGPITSDLAYQINWDTNAMASDAVKALADIMGGKGNIIEIRGLAGVPFDDAFHGSVVNALKAYPNVKVVGTVYGEWTESVAQQQVASILPGIAQVDGILGQGGDEYGALQAFLAAGRKVPVIIGGNRGNFLKWWSDEKAKNGYKSYSWAANPWSAASGLYVAVDLLRGVKVPKTMIMPALSVTQDMVDGFATLKADEVAAKEYDHDWIVKTYYK